MSRVMSPCLTFPLSVPVPVPAPSQMLAMGLPLPQIKHALKKDGLSEAVADKDPNEQIPLEGEEKAPMVAVKDHPKYRRFFSMLKMHVPKDAIKHKMTKEGVDPAFLDKDPEEQVPMEEEEGKEGASAGGAAPPPPPVARPRVSKVRRKKLYWKEIPTDRLASDSIWKEQGGMDLDLDFDVKEFEALFVSSGSPTSDSAKAVGKLKIDKKPVSARGLLAVFPRDRTHF